MALLSHFKPKKYRRCGGFLTGDISFVLKNAVAVLLKRCALRVRCWEKKTTIVFRGHRALFATYEGHQ